MSVFNDVWLKYFYQVHRKSRRWWLFTFSLLTNNSPMLETSHTLSSVRGWRSNIVSKLHKKFISTKWLNAILKFIFQLRFLVLNICIVYKIKINKHCSLCHGGDATTRVCFTTLNTVPQSHTGNGNEKYNFTITYHGLWTRYLHIEFEVIAIERNYVCKIAR